MTTRAICTIVAGDFDEIFKVTEARMRAYAEMCDADFIVFDGNDMDPRWGPTPHFAKYQLFSEMAETDYEHVLYLDADIYCRQSAPDIFREYTLTAARSEFPHPRANTVMEAIKWIKENCDPLWPNTRYYNTGVLLFDDVCLMKLARQLADVRPKKGRFFEQCQLNWLMHRAGFPEQQLGLQWNAPVGDNWQEQVKDFNKVFFIHGNAVAKENKLAKLTEAIEKYP